MEKHYSKLKKLKFYGTMAIFGSSLVLGYKVGKITKIDNNLDKNISFEDNNNNNNNTDNIDEDSNNYFIETMDEAERLGYLDKNPSKDELIEAVNNNINITDEYDVKNYFYNYINAICEKYPDLDKSILKKNIELLRVNYLSAEEMVNSTNNKYAQASFMSYYHILNLCTDVSIDDVIYHEISHMLRVISCETKDDKFIYLDFSDDDFGQAIEEEMNTTFTDTVMYNNTGYQVNNVYLLQELLGEKELYDIYFNGNIHTLIKKLDSIDNSIDAEAFINRIDCQNNNYFDNNNNNDYDEDIELYNTYIDYFMSKEENDSYATFDEDCQDFKNIIYKNITTHENTKDILDNFNNEIDQAYVKK